MSSIIKVDTIQNQSGANIISESSNTITVGASGDTITVPSGCAITNNGTQTGFDEFSKAYFFTKDLTGLQAIPTVTDTAIVNWNTPTKSTQGTFSSGIYTPGIAGTYIFNSNINIGNCSDTMRVFIYIQKSENSGVSWSTIGAGNDVSGNANADIVPQVTTIHSLTASTQIRVACWHEYGSNRNAQAGLFWGYLLKAT